MMQLKCPELSMFLLLGLMVPPPDLKHIWLICINQTRQRSLTSWIYLKIFGKATTEVS